MKCPNCNETLLMAERHQVEIDYCPNCRGVWLDRGELDKLLQFEAGQKSPAEPRFEDRRDERYDRYDERRDRSPYTQKYPRKKKSFFSDFFDFD